MPEVLAEVAGIVEERESQSREERVRVARVDERRGFLGDASDDEVGLQDDAVVLDSGAVSLFEELEL